MYLVVKRKKTYGLFDNMILILKEHNTTKSFKMVILKFNSLQVSDHFLIEMTFILLWKGYKTLSRDVPRMWHFIA